MAAPLGFIRQLSILKRTVRPRFARAVAYALLCRLVTHTAPALGMPRYRRRLPRGAQTLVDGIAQFLIAQPLEEAAYYLSCVYAVLSDSEERRELAMYFTPPELARHIVSSVCEETSSFTSMRFMDPACGGAAFLLPVAILLRDDLRKRRAPPHEIIRAINRQVSGIEKNPVLAELAWQFIRIVIADELTQSRVKLGPIIREGDALHLLARKKIPPVDVMLCNPPYRKIRATELAWYRGRFPEIIVGQPNLYTMFMRIATELVAPGGTIALLTPTSYFSGPTYERIRARYTRQCSIIRIDLMHERDNLFLGVEHDVAALVARPRLSRPALQTPEVFAWDDLNKVTSLGEIALPTDGAPWHLPRDAATASALEHSKAGTWSLAQYGYRARVGGYVWNRDKRRPRKARPKGRERHKAVPVIWATQIGQDGTFRFVSKSPKERRARFVLLRPNDRRGVFEQDCVVLQRTSSRGQKRRLVAAALPRGFAKRHGGFVGENHILILEPTSKRPLIPRRLLARLLNSAFIRDLYSTTTGTAAVTTAGLNDLSLPDPNKLKRLIRKSGLKRAIHGAFATGHSTDRGRKSDAEAPAP